MGNSGPLVPKSTREKLEHSKGQAFPGIVNIRDETGNLIYSNKDIAWGVKTVFFNHGSQENVYVECPKCKDETQESFAKLLNNKTLFQSLYCKCGGYRGVIIKDDLKRIVCNEKNKEYFAGKEAEIDGIMNNLPDKVDEKPMTGFGGVYVH